MENWLSYLMKVLKQYCCAHYFDQDLMSIFYMLLNFLKELWEIHLSEYFAFLILILNDDSKLILSFQYFLNKSSCHAFEYDYFLNILSLQEIAFLHWFPKVNCHYHFLTIGFFIEVLQDYLHCFIIKLIEALILSEIMKKFFKHLLLELSFFLKELIF